MAELSALKIMERACLQAGMTLMQLICTNKTKRLTRCSAGFFPLDRRLPAGNHQGWRCSIILSKLTGFQHRRHSLQSSASG